MTIWYEDDDFWKTLAPRLFGRERWENTPAEVEKTISLLEINPGAQVLDLCCGPGRHSLELARRGFQVTGVDRTSGYLEDARKSAAAEKLNVEFLQEDMRSFCRPGSFDAVLNLFTSFGYFEDLEDDERVLNNIYSSLKAGGRLIMEMIGKEVLARTFCERVWSEEDGEILLEERKLSSGWNWIQSRWILIKDGDRKEFTISNRLYSAVELSGLLTEAGFTSVKVFGNLNGAPYDHMAERLVAVAVK